MVLVLCLPSAASVCFPVVWGVPGSCWPQWQFSFPQLLVVSLKTSVNGMARTETLDDYRVETLVLPVIAAHFPNLCLK